MSFLLQYLKVNGVSLTILFESINTLLLCMELRGQIHSILCKMSIIMLMFWTPVHLHKLMQL